MIRLFGRPLLRKQVLFTVSDIIVLAVTPVLASYLRFDPGQAHRFVMENLPTFFLQGVVFMACFFIADLYNVNKDYRRPEQFLYIMSACFFGMLFSMILFYAKVAYIGRGILLIYSGAVFLFCALARAYYSYDRSAVHKRSRVLLVGAGKSGQGLLDVIMSNPNCGLWVVGFVDDDPEKHGESVMGVPVLGGTADIAKLTRDMGIDMIVLCVTDRKSDELIGTLIKCHYRDIRVVDMPTVYEGITGKLPVKLLNDEWLLYSALSNQRLLFYNTKRFADIILSVALFLATMPLMLLAAILIRLDSKGDVLYRQERLGRNYGRFTIYKFRTMVMDAERHTGAVWASKDDPRTTRVGGVLRKLRIDELPQLINVIKGEMSFVGPRPEREVFVRELEESIPAYTHRLMVKPGLTGWAQVMYEYAATKEESAEKLCYDLYYVKNMSILLDVLIMLKTLRIVFLFKGH